MLRATEDWYMETQIGEALSFFGPQQRGEEV